MQMVAAPKNFLIRRRGFTLIELLITIAIIGILTAMATLAYSTVTQRGRDAQRMNDLNEIKVALTSYYDAQVPRAYVSVASATTINDSTDALTTALKPNFIRDVPVDPTNGGNFLYKYTSQNSAANFLITATLENKSNKKGWAGGSAWVANGYQVTDN